LSAGGWGDGLQLIAFFSLAPQAVAILGFASARSEIVGFQPKAGSSAASSHGFKRASRPFAAGGAGWLR